MVWWEGHARVGGSRSSELVYRATELQSYIKETDVYSQPLWLVEWTSPVLKRTARSTTTNEHEDYPCYRHDCDPQPARTTASRAASCVQ